jgi:hypothetical protein
MKTIPVYQFEELPEDVQKKAVEDYKNRACDDLHHQEIFDSYEAIKKEIPKLSEEVKNFTGKRAMAWVENNILAPHRIRYTDVKRKQYRKYGEGYRPGQVKPGPFTGLCYDEDFLAHIVKETKNGQCIGDTIRQLEDVCEHLIEQEQEYISSFEYLKEEIISREHLYTIGGVQV